MPGARLDHADIINLLEAVQASLDQGALITQAYKYVARGFGVSEKTVSNYWLAYKPTTKLATMKIRAKAVDIVDKILDKAPTNELIDILSRPNVGVLEPLKSAGQGGGFIVSVSADSCGGVKMAVAGGIEGGQTPPNFPLYNKDTHFQLEGEVSDGKDETSGEITVSSAEALRERLKAARERESDAPDDPGSGRQRGTGGAGDGSLQTTDGKARSRSVGSPDHHSKINLRWDHESFPESEV